MPTHAYLTSHEPDR